MGGDGGYGERSVGGSGDGDWWRQARHSPQPSSYSSAIVTKRERTLEKDGGQGGTGLNPLSFIPPPHSLFLLSHLP